MNKINLKKENSTVQEKAEENIEKIDDNVYRIYPTITRSPERKKEIRNDIIICLIANVIITLIVNGVAYLLGK